MKYIFTQKLHIYILTCLSFLFSLSLFLYPSKVQAVCSSIYHSGSTKCPSAAGSAVVFCQASTECSAAKSPTQTWDPASGCTDGINTALGCLPYKTDAFGPTLFGFFVGFAGMIALFLMLFATSLYMTSGGDHEQLKKAKELFTAAITGLIFIVFSVALLRITAGNVIKLPGFTQIGP